jgi:MYXO-CTERM domain-containing protein
LRSGAELNRLGQLMRLAPGSSTPVVVADVADFEVAENPAGAQIDSNPYKIKVQTDGILIADAGADAVLKVNFDASIDIVDTLPSLAGGVDAVPTSIAIGGGQVYVSQLTGFPFTPGSASVFQLEEGGLTLLGSGFTNVIDLAYGPDNMLYVLELSHGGLLSGDLTGGLWRLDPATGLADLLMTEGLLAPTALGFDQNGILHIANRGLMPGQGEILALTPVPEPEVTGALAAAALVGLVAWRKRRARNASLSAPNFG